MVYKFNNLSKFKNLKNIVSTRLGGVSIGEKSSLNLSYKVGDDNLNVIENRRLLALELGINSDSLIFPDQTHSCHVQIVNSIEDIEKLKNTDAIITNVPQLCLCVMSADCVPILLFDSKQNVVAAIHAGWRGTVADIVTKTIQLMNTEFGSQSEDIYAAIGPSISADVYEVGIEVIDSVFALLGYTEGLIVLKDFDKGMLDLWETNRHILLKAGLLADNIEVAEICTFKNNESFFSYRKSSETGRFAAGICLI